MNDEATNNAAPEPCHEKPDGLTHEWVMLSIRIAHTRSIGQFDDSCAMQLEKAMQEYNGIVDCDVDVLYRHGSEQTHVAGCECGDCEKSRSHPFKRKPPQPL